MKVVTNGYKNNIKLMGKEIDSLITYTINGVQTELGSEELNSVTPHYKADILKSVMKQLDIDSNVDIPLNTVINYQFGVKVDDEEVLNYRDNYEYINYGNYVVAKSEKNEDTNSYQLTCYDKMLYAMKNYEDMNITYPTTIRSYINSLATYLGLTFKNASDTFVNYNRTVPEELFLNPDGEGIGYTFRDVLDELAEVTASIICINEDDDELEIRYPTNSGVTLDEEWFSDVNVKFSNIAGPFNTVVLTRGDGTDKISQSIPSNLPDEDKIAIVIKENQFMNENDRSDYIPDILNQINGLTYSICDYSSPGITFLELGDKYNASINNVSYPCLMLGDETPITQGLKENVATEEPNTYQEDYAYVEPTDKAIREAGIKIDKKIAEVDIRGKTINLTADDINITSNNFSVDSTGRITATSGNIAGFETNNDGFSYEIKPKYDYDQSDITTMSQIMMGQITPTEEQMDKYDINKDGEINSLDLVAVNWYILLNLSPFTPGAFKIEIPTNKDFPLPNRLKVGLYDGYGDIVSGFTYRGVYSNGNLIGKYSTNEIVVGEWINGETLYRQVLPITLAGSNENISHYISNIGTVTRSDIVLKNSSTVNQINPLALTTNNYALIWAVTDTVIVIHETSYCTDIPAYIILEYTKS